jgi:hypothetical protein
MNGRKRWADFNRYEKHGECKIIFGDGKKRKIKLSHYQKMQKEMAFDNMRKDWKGYNG